MADARRLIQESRVKAQSYWLTYEEPIPAEALAEHICDLKAQYTQGGGARPYGVAMIIGSVDHDESPRLFVTDPVGTYWGYLAAVIGRGAAVAGEHLQKNYKKTMTLKQATNLALDTLRAASDVEFNTDNIEIAQIPIKTSEFHKLDSAEIDIFLNPKSAKSSE